MKKILFGIIVALFCSAWLIGQGPSVDLLIQGGTVMDGSGSEPVTADIGIKGDRIEFIGDARASRISAARTLDANGLIVAPGFIDPHTHTLEDLSSADGKTNLPFLMQGVTTVVTGNDGGGPITVARTFETWEKQGIGTNAALLVGQGTVREQVMKMTDARPTREQVDRMKAIVGEAMDAGAIGMSTGLYYAPGSYSTTEEVIELAKIAAAKSGVYDSHMRDESSYTIGLIGSIEETIRIGREASMPVHISHIKALGTDVWGQEFRSDPRDSARAGPGHRDHCRPVSVQASGSASALRFFRDGRKSAATPIAARESPIPRRGRNSSPKWKTICDVAAARRFVVDRRRDGIVSSSANASTRSPSNGTRRRSKPRSTSSRTAAPASRRST